MNKQDSPLKTLKCFSIPVSLSLLLFNLAIAMAVYILLKTIPHFSTLLPDKNIFLLLNEFITNLLMTAFLLRLRFLKLNETPEILKFKRELLIVIKLPALFIFSYFLLITAFSYFKIPSFGFDVFKTSFFTPSGQSILSANNLILFVNICILAPLKEEILIRRFLYVSLRKKMPGFLSSFLSSIFFGLIHGNFTTAFIYSLMASYIYEKYGSLKINIMMHAIVNFLIICMFFALRSR